MPDGTLFLKAARGEEIVSALAAFLNECRILAGSFTAIGAVSEAEIGHYSVAEKAYHKVSLREPMEVLALTGNVSRTDDGKALAHPHVVLGLRDMSAKGGHLFRAVAEPTCEIVLRPFAAAVERRMDEAVGLKLWRLAGA